MREQIGWMAFFGAAAIAIGMWLKGANLFVSLVVGFAGSFVASMLALMIVFRGDIPE